MLSVSGHKIHGPKGVGILYIDEHVKIKPIIFGGGQQKGMRSGTENVPGIAGIGKATELSYANLDRDVERLYELKRYFEDGLQKLSGVVINGPLYEQGAPHIVSASFAGVRSEVLLHALEDKGIYVSAGSACDQLQMLCIEIPRNSAQVKVCRHDNDKADCQIQSQQDFSFCFIFSSIFHETAFSIR